MQIDDSHGRVPASLPPQSDELLALLQLRKGATSYADFADDVCRDPSMLRAYMSGRSGAGLDTLCVLIAWSPDLQEMVTQMMIERGMSLRSAYRSKRAECGVSG